MCALRSGKCRRRLGLAVAAGLWLLALAPGWVRAQPTVRQGDTGPTVRYLQQLLNEEDVPNPHLVTDGQFGPKTNQAVQQFQRQAGLTADGIVGPHTWTALLLGPGGMSFPLQQRPRVDYHTGARYFGAPRDGGARAHAACDLIAPPNTPVLAIADGVVQAGPYAFYEGTYALEVRHANFVVRYGEISGTVPAGIRTGAHVTRGQVIARVGLNTSGTSMLHLEMYKGTVTGPLTQVSNTIYLYVPARNYERRRDLIDPTPYLDRWPLP